MNRSEKLNKNVIKFFFHFLGVIFFPYPSFHGVKKCDITSKLLPLKHVVL